MELWKHLADTRHELSATVGEAFIDERVSEIEGYGPYDFVQIRRFVLDRQGQS
jgi:hypothetical protein